MRGGKKAFFGFFGTVAKKKKCISDNSFDCY